MSLLLPVLSTEIIEAMCLFTFHYVSITTVTANNYFKVNTDFTFHYVSITTGDIREGPLDDMLFTFHYVSITTRTSQSPTLQSQFYHFLSTLSFSLLIEYKYQQYRKKISYFYSKIAYLSTSHVFCFITGRQL